MINEVGLLTGSAGVSHNGIFRGKNLGTINNLNEYIAFRTAHGIDDNTYKDLFLGDYFQINDGTYNAVWMVAHFDYYHYKGETVSVGISVPKGVVIIPRIPFTEAVMMHEKVDNKDTTVGAYKGSLAYTTHCPSVAGAMQTVFGSYLKSIVDYLSNYMNPTTASNAGAGYVGAVTGAEWTAVNCILPSELQVYGAGVFTSSAYDVGVANEKLAVFNFVNHVEFAKYPFWTKNIADASRYAFANSLGNSASTVASSNAIYIRPLLYIT